jgi:hypothetical protein
VGKVSIETNQPADAMKNKILFLSILTIGLGLAGCSRKATPVSSIEKVTEKKDSVTSVAETRKDSAFYKETVTEKVIPGGTVGLTMTKAELEAVLKSLASLPPSVTHSIYKTDPKTQAMIELVLDSLGKVHFNCTTADQRCLQITKESARIHEVDRTEITKVKEENTRLKNEIVELKKPWYQRITDSLNGLLIKILLGFLAFGFVVIISDFIKRKVSLLWNRFKPKI